jgi:hypothetical protein
MANTVTTEIRRTMERYIANPGIADEKIDSRALENPTQPSS